jgi:glycosyltransferase involved in cell wall biosynthesis
VKGLRIGLATPFNVKSAIAVYSREVGHELARRGHHVDILRTETADAVDIPALATTLEVLTAPESPVHRFDLCLVNIGNYVRFHGAALPLLETTPSVVVLHDADLSDLAWHLRVVDDPLLDPGMSVPGLEEPEARDGGLMMRLAALGVAAVVHGPHYLDAVANACPGPVAQLPLCYSTPDRDVAPARNHDDRLVIVIFGMMNPNKQARRVLRALHLVPDLAGRAELRLVGQIESSERERLISLARDLGLQLPVFHDGWVPEADLWRHLGDADVICSLRYPVTEGGSASLVEALASGRPVIVADYASYAMVPKDLVSFVSYGERPDDLAQALVDIDCDREAAFARAARAAEWAREAYSARRYVDGLEPLLDRAMHLVPNLELSRAVGRTVLDMGLHAGDPFLDRLEKVFSGLYPTPKDFP